jgi:malate dehydrogenase
MTSRVKVAVTGAAGQIGYAFIFRLASGAVFGPDVVVDLNLIEVEAALPALQGVMMELEDCAFKTLGKVVATSDLKVGMNGINYAALIGAMPRKDGMERADLLKINGGIFGPQGKAINDYAADDVKVLVVGNPCNTNALIAMHAAPDVPSDRFFAMTMLDQNRAVSQLAMKAGTDLKNVSNMIIWGNHSATQFPNFYDAKINGKPVTDVITDHAWLVDTFVPMIQKRGAAVIKARGASSAASAANGIIDGLRALAHNTPAGQSYSMAMCSNGAYGVDKGLIFSFPCRTENGVVRIVEGVPLCADAKKYIQNNIDELRAEKQAVQDLLK